MTAQVNCNDTFSLFDTAREHLPTWSQWMRVGMRKAWRDMCRVAKAAVACEDRRAGRHLLLTLDDRMLKDIGISRADAWAEAIKPMWRD